MNGGKKEEIDVRPFVNRKLLLEKDTAKIHNVKVGKRRYIYKTKNDNEGLLFLHSLTS